MRFEDKGLTPGNYKWAFLASIVELAPEVMKSLRTLTPKYKKVFGAFDYRRAMDVFDFLVASKTNDLNYILSEIDDNFRHINPHAPVPDEARNTTLKYFLDFQNSFYEFIERYGLTTDWLKAHFSDLLYIMVNNPNLTDKMLLASAHSYMPYSGGALIFEFDGWQIENDSKDYKKAAINAFRRHLKEYIEKTGEQAKADGYKLAKGKRDFDSVKWLVLWTVKKLSKDKILERIDEERSIKFGREKYTDVSTLNKAFAKFKKFDLPVREE